MLQVVQECGGHKGKGCTAVALSEGRGIPVAMGVYPASTHQSQTAEAVLQRVRVPQARSRPRKGIRASVPERRYKHRCKRGPKPRLLPASRQRYQVERLHAWLDNYHAIVVRYERKPQNYRGLMVFAALLICIRALLHW